MPIRAIALGLRQSVPLLHFRMAVRCPIHVLFLEETVDGH